MRIEEWNGHQIRFVEKDGVWWAVLKDVCDALNLKSYYVKERLDNDVVSTEVLKDVNGRPHETLIVNEFGIYDTVFQSRKKEAIEFRHWVYDMISHLRTVSGLEGFQIFRVLDKDHQKEMMKNLCNGRENPKRKDFIKCNTIANKAVSTKYGHSKMVKKEQMTSEMLVAREPILEDTVNLMNVNDEYRLGISVSQAIYQKHCGIQKEQKKNECE